MGAGARGYAQGCSDPGLGAGWDIADIVDVEAEGEVGNGKEEGGVRGGVARVGVATVGLG